MHAVLSTAEALLRRHPAPALPLSELTARLRTAGPDRRLTDARLRDLLERHPGRFRLVEVWSDPWPGSGVSRRNRAGQVPGRVFWVAAVRPDPDPPAGSGLAGPLRETVRWLAARLDVRSRSDVARWHRLALAEEAARRSLRDAAA